MAIKYLKGHFQESIGKSIGWQYLYMLTDTHTDTNTNSKIV